MDTRTRFDELLHSDRPLIMGVLNVTPDSFSDGGAFLDPGKATKHALEMISQGADIIDIGGESTRPAGKAYGVGAQRVELEEELRRVSSVIEFIAAASPGVVISIDTTKSRVAEAALSCGATMVNDVSAGTSDLQMFATAAHHHAPIILMHGYGPEFDKPVIEDYHYDDVVAEVRHFLFDRANRAMKEGIETVLIDAGIGFAKTFDDNMLLIKELDEFASGWPVVLGVSRKSSMGRAMGGDPPPDKRLMGSIAASCYGVMHGAKIIRTHDVKETREALSVMSAIRHAHQKASVA